MRQPFRNIASTDCGEANCRVPFSENVGVQGVTTLHPTHELNDVLQLSESMESTQQSARLRYPRRNDAAISRSSRQCDRYDMASEGLGPTLEGRGEIRHKDERIDGPLPRCSVERKSRTWMEGAKEKTDGER